MRCILAAIVALALSGLSALSTRAEGMSSNMAHQEGNVAYQDDCVRFTVITDGVIRLEWQPQGQFTDLASFVASEREYPQVDYKVSTKGKSVEIATSKMILTYTWQ